eukprot:m.450581 g.450581  ORF g.450581 m.450581 type:complete len:77 (+) comp20019_c0_seq1:2474-2704(+)
MRETVREGIASKYVIPPAPTAGLCGSIVHCEESATEKICKGTRLDNARNCSQTEIERVFKVHCTFLKFATLQYELR